MDVEEEESEARYLKKMSQRTKWKSVWRIFCSLRRGPESPQGSELSLRHHLLCWEFSSFSFHQPLNMKFDEVKSWRVQCRPSYRQIRTIIDTILINWDYWLSFFIDHFFISRYFQAGNTCFWNHLLKCNFGLKEKILGLVEVMSSRLDINNPGDLKVFKSWVLSS